MQGIDGPIRATDDVTVEPLTETSSQLTIVVDFDGHGIGKLLVPLVVRRQAQQLRLILAMAPSTAQTETTK